jgi:predicted ArsR family transcriptional regulator
MPASENAALYVLAHPARRAITEALLKNPARASDLAEELNLPLHTVTFHLDTLEEHGLIEQREWIGGNHGSVNRAVPLYQLTPKVEQVIRHLSDKVRAS